MTQQYTVVPMTDEHWSSMWPDQDLATAKFGFTGLRPDGSILFLGGLMYWIDRWWATFWCDDDPPISVHRYGFIVLGIARKEGIPEVWAQTAIDHDVGERWVKRHGFQLVEQLDAARIWRLDFGRSDLNDGSGSWHSDVRDGPIPAGSGS